MATQWYCKISGHVRGPLTAQQLKAMATHGRIQPDDQVRQGDQGEWVPAGRVKGLFGKTAKAPTSESDDATPMVRAKPLEEEPLADSKPVQLLDDATPAATSGGPQPVPGDAPPSAAPLGGQPQQPGIAGQVAQPLGQPPTVPGAPSGVPVGQMPQQPPQGAIPPSAPADPPGGAKDGPAGTPPFPLAGTSSGVASRRSRRSANRPTPQQRRRKNLIALVVLLVLIAGLAGGGIWYGMTQTGDKQAASDNVEEEIDLSDLDIDRPKNVDAEAYAAAKAQKKDGASEASGTAAEEGAGEGWVNASEGSIRRGDVKISVKSALVGLPQFDRRVRQPDPEEYLMITLELKNLGATKKLDFAGFSSGAIARMVSLMDNFANQYKRKRFSGAKVAGQSDGDSIYPGKSVTDVLVFEPPIGKAESFKLVLPAAAFGGAGALKFSIPKKMIGEAEPPPEPAGDDAIGGALGNALEKPAAPPDDGPLPPERAVPAIERGIEELDEQEQAPAEAGGPGDQVNMDRGDSGQQAGGESGIPDIVSKVNEDTAELGGGDEENESHDFERMLDGSKFDELEQRQIEEREAAESGRRRR